MDDVCPFCLNEVEVRSSCNECGGTGMFDIEPPSGGLYVLMCSSQACAFDHGTRIVGPSMPPLEIGVQVCIVCGSKADYELITWVDAPEMNDGE